MTRRAVRVAVEAVETRRLFSAPVLDSIANQTLPVGKTIQVPVTSASDAGAVTYSVRDSSGNVAGSFRSSNSTFISMKVAGYNSPMVFELFNDSAPDTVRRIVGLINSRYYDGLTFHRILNDFVIQGGDPAGDGSGGPEFTFDDEFDASTVFTGTGQLAMANSGKDTNGSQFFITEGPQRLLDFNHTIFGQLVRGETTRAAISDVAVDADGKPNTNVVITSVRVVKDTTDGVLVMTAKAAGAYRIKVTATNADGSTSKSFTLTAATDTINDPPILNTAALQPVYYTAVGTPVTIDLSSLDPEGDAGYYGAQYIDQNGATGAFAGTNQENITITPTKAGAVTLLVGVVSSSSATSRGSTSINQSNPINIYDTQKITIAAGESPISVSANNFDAPSGIATGNFQIGSIRDSDLGGSVGNFTAKIDWGDGTVTDGTISRSSKKGRYAVYGSKTYGTRVLGDIPVTVTVTGNNGAVATATSYAAVRPITSLDNGVLTINGTAADDRIGISRKGTKYYVTVNKRTTSFAKSSISSFAAYGFDGDDTITVADTVFIGAYLEGDAGNDALTGGMGNDTIGGNAGDDTIVTGEGANRADGGAGNDVITGGGGKDRLNGGDGNDNIESGGGRDISNGDAGNDTVVGGSGNDNVYGGEGKDILNGGSGTDLIDGGAGKDTARDDDRDTFVSVETLVA